MKDKSDHTTSKKNENQSVHFDLLIFFIIGNFSQVTF